MPLQLRQGPHCLAPQFHRTGEQRQGPVHGSKPARRTGRRVGGHFFSPATGLGARICPSGPLSVWTTPTSEHPGAAGARCPWGPAALCQWVAADDQLQHLARLSQERHRQAAIEVPCANVVDLHGAQPRGWTGISPAWAEGVGIMGFPKCGPCPSPDTR